MIADLLGKFLILLCGLVLIVIGGWLALVFWESFWVFSIVIGGIFGGFGLLLISMLASDGF